jgi:electron transport complex protein RnfB
MPLDRELQPMDALAVALIDESRCIGCALCLPACPVDAIAGAAGHMHTVVARHCTGCELCIPACPVDCIAMTSPPSDSSSRPSVRTAGAAAESKRRFEAHKRRLAAQALAAEGRRLQRQARLSARRDWDDA